MIEHLIDAREWAAPLLIVVGGGVVAGVGYGYVRRRRAERRAREAQWKRYREERERDAAAAGPLPEYLREGTPPAPFVAPPRVVEVSTEAGLTRVLYAEFGPAVPSGHFPSMNAAMAGLLSAALTHGVWRVLIDVPSFGPSSRYFFHCLRSLAWEASRHAGVLVIRYQPETDRVQFSGDPPSPFYTAVPAADRTLEESLMFTATLPTREVPELDEL